MGSDPAVPLLSLATVAAVAARPPGPSRVWGCGAFSLVHDERARPSIVPCAGISEERDELANALSEMCAAVAAVGRDRSEPGSSSSGSMATCLAPASQAVVAGATGEDGPAVDPPLPVNGSTFGGGGGGRGSSTSSGGLVRSTATASITRVMASAYSGGARVLRRLRGKQSAGPERREGAADDPPGGGRGGAGRGSTRGSGWGTGDVSAPAP